MKQWQNLMANLVAAILKRSICHILYVTNIILGSIGLDFVSPEWQQRPYYMALDWKYTMESRYACTPQKIDKKSFYRVIAMMCGENGKKALLRTYLLEKIIPKPSCRILHTEMGASSVLLGVELGNINGNLIFLSHLTDKLFVAVAIAGSKVKITMRNSERETGRIHQMGKYRRVHTATNSKQHLLPRREEMLLLNVRYEPREHYY